MDQGKFSPDVSTRSLTQSTQPISYNRGDQTIQTPPRIVSDQLINIYFQEWAPLYPVVHRPTVLKAYEQYLADSLQGSSHDLAQLNLVFGIAALASTVSLIFLLLLFLRNWTKFVTVEDQPGPRLLREKLDVYPRIALYRHFRPDFTMLCFGPDLLHDQGGLQ